MTTTGPSAADGNGSDGAAAGAAYDAAALSRLQEQLGGAVGRADPVPADVLAAARAAFVLRTLDEELAALVADSSLQAGAPVRAGLTTRLLSFEATDSGVEVELSDGAHGVDLQGQSLGGLPGVVVVEHDEGQVALEVDALGRFAAQDLPRGRLRLTWLAPSGRRAATPWFEA